MKKKEEWYKHLWENKENKITLEITDEGKKKYSGGFVYNFCAFAFTLNEQNLLASKYEFRGELKALDQFGKVLKDRNKRVVSDLYLHSDAMEEIKKKVAEEAVDLYSNHTKVLTKDMKEKYSPERIIPAVAATLKAREYAEFEHCRHKERTKQNATRNIMNTCAKLPIIPMQDFKKSDIDKYFRYLGISGNVRNEMHKFWRYCIQNGICLGTNPVEMHRSKDSMTKKEKEEVLKKAIIPLAGVDKVFDAFEKDVGGLSVGGALLFSGVDKSVIEELKWKDITFMDAEKRDFARIWLYDKYRKDATHNLTRVLLPRTAEVLKENHDALKKCYDVEEIKNFPICGQKADPTKRITIDNIYSYVESILKELGLLTVVDISAIKETDKRTSPIRKICTETYDNLLINECNLDEDNMTFKFLTNKTFKRDSTLDYYTAMASHIGWDHMYTAMAPLRKKVIVSNELAKRNNTAKVVYAVPTMTRENAKIICKVILKPGEEIIIKCPHGVRGSAKGTIKKPE